MAWKVGDFLQGDKYQVEKILGQGSFGITYLVKDRQGDRAVIKTLEDSHISATNLQQRQERFVKEAFKLSKCQHPHIVRLLEAPFQAETLWQDPLKPSEPPQLVNLWCIAMEYIDGTTLADRANQILSESVALNYIKQIGSALIVVHQNQLVHNDVRPGNIMIRAGSAEAVLIDFGLAREGDRALRIGSLTVATEPNYAAIEMYSDQIPLRAYTDVYSLAVTLYNLLTGKLPETAQNRQANPQLLTPPKEHNGQISDQVNDAILWGMKLDPKERPQSIKEWLDALEKAPNPDPPNLPVSPPIDPHIQLVHKGLQLNWMAIIIAFLGLAIAIWAGLPGWLDRMNKPTPTPTNESK